MSQGYKNNHNKRNRQDINRQETEYPFERDQIERRRKSGNKEQPPQKPHKEKLPSTVEEQIEKLRDLVKNGSVEEYYNKVHSYIADWKNEYRKQISV